MPMEMKMGNLARKVERLQARKNGIKKADPAALLRSIQTLPQALGSLDKVAKQLDDSQTAIVQMLQELDYQDFETRRQRAVSLRMQVDTGLGVSPLTKVATDFPEVYAEAVLEYEAQLRAEYDAMFWVVKLFDWYLNLGKEQ
jgi:DNA-binding MurR/RpiR family transcriptional regulator